MTASSPTSATSRQNGLSSEARNLHWLLTNLVEEVPGLNSVAVVSSDGLMLLSSDPGRNEPATREAPQGPKGSSADLATIVSGVGSLTIGRPSSWSRQRQADDGRHGGGQPLRHVHQ